MIYNRQGQTYPMTSCVQPMGQVCRLHDHTMSRSTRRFTFIRINLLHRPDECGLLIAVLRHIDIFLGQTAREMCCPVYVDGTWFLFTQTHNQKNLSCFDRGRKEKPTTVIVGWWFFDLLRMPTTCVKSWHNQTKHISRIFQTNRQQKRNGKNALSI